MDNMLTLLIQVHPQRAAMLKTYVQLKLATRHNTCMHAHYKRLYNKHRKGWNFFKTAAYCIKMMHYERRMMVATIKENLFILNKTSHG